MLPKGCGTSLKHLIITAGHGKTTRIQHQVSETNLNRNSLSLKKSALTLCTPARS